MRAAAVSTVIAAVLLAAGCGEAPSTATDSSAGYAPPMAGQADQDLETAQSLGRGAASEVSAVAPAAPPSPATTSGALGPVAPNMIIRNGSASVEVDSLEPALAAVRRLVARVGGYVGNSSLQAGDESERSALLELRIPADRFDEVVAGLQPVARSST